MNIAGIVAEYNPFHNGHARHIADTRAALGPDSAVICCMSGDFVQRGEAAVWTKYARAEAAAGCGADLVFELPLPWSVASAEGFARGAVGLLGSLGVVTHLSFGSECGQAEPLERLARALLDPATHAVIREELEYGASYAAARQRALERVVGEEARRLETPNNILGVEYIRALYDLRMEMDILTMPRCQAAHDGAGEGIYRSASEVRARIRAGESAEEFIPPSAGEVYAREADRGRGPVSMEKLESALLSRLRMLGDGDFDALPDATEGLGNRLRAAARTEPSWDGVLSAAKSKRYALSRIRRMCLCAALGVRAGMNDGVPGYARLLAVSGRGRELLRLVSERTRIPVINKPASVKALDRESGDIFALGASAHDLYALAFSAGEERRGGADWRTGPALE